MNLTTKEYGELLRHEVTIKAGKDTFVKVGLALCDIRDRRLYREKHDSFNAYCETKWGWTRQRADQLIQAATVVQALPSKLTTRVVNEKSARAIAKVPKEQRAEVVEAVIRNGLVTPRTIAEQAKKTMDAVVVRRDNLQPNSRIIPPEMLEDWDRAEAMAKHLRGLAHEVKLAVERGTQGETKDQLFAELGQSARSDAAKIWNVLGALVPYTICPFCHGKLRNTCQPCDGRGFVSEDYFNGPRVEKKVRAMIHQLATNET